MHQLEEKFAIKIRVKNFKVVIYDSNTVCRFHFLLSNKIKSERSLYDMHNWGYDFKLKLFPNFK